MGNESLLVCKQKTNFPRCFWRGKGNVYALLGKRFLRRLLVCSVQEKVHNKFNVISPLQENGEPGKLSLTERLEAGCPWILGERGHCFFVFPDTLLGEKKSVADSVTNPFITPLPSPPVSSPISFFFICFFQRPWLIILCYSPDTAPVRQMGALSVCLRQLLPFFEEAAKAAELVGHFPFFKLTAKAFSSSFTCWLHPLKALAQSLTLQQIGRGKKAFQLISPEEQALGDCNNTLNFCGLSHPRNSEGLLNSLSLLIH